MRKVNILILFLISVFTLVAQNRISICIGNANKYASVDLSDYRKRLCLEYNMSDRLLGDYYDYCDRDWGNVSVLLEIARTSGRPVRDVCRYYQRYKRHGWDRVLIEVGIRPDSRYYEPFYDRIHYHGVCWHDYYDSYYRNHHRDHYYKPHKHHRKYHKYYYKKRYKWDDDDDDDDYDDDDDDDD